jgi:tetratricopeptide (TPR) repeat protein
MPGQTRRYGGLVIVGLALATVFNLPWLAKYLQVAKATDSQILQLLSNPTVMVGANLVAGALIVWGLFKLLLASNPKQRLVRTLIGRGDYVGAAQLQAQEGDLKGALTLYRKGKAWSEAARTALELGHDHEAGDLLRRAGGHSLAEATRLFRRAGDIAAAQRCERDLAEWLSSRGRYDEAVEAWMRAGEPKRAAGATMIALEQGQFSSSHTALPVARRAVEQAGDHRAPVFTRSRAIGRPPRTPGARQASTSRRLRFSARPASSMRPPSPSQRPDTIRKPPNFASINSRNCGTDCPSAKRAAPPATRNPKN